MIFSLNLAKAELRETDVVIQLCDTGPMRDRAACCKDKIQECKATAQQHADYPAFNFCKKCIWGNLSYLPNQYGDELQALKDCQRGEQ